MKPARPNQTFKPELERSTIRGVIETKERNKEIRFLFVGENRSSTAQRKGYTWEDCPDEGVLCAKKLFSALRKAGIEPREHDFTNAWDDNGSPQEIDVQGKIVVAMGQKVQDELIRRGIIFIPIVHPAARGVWCRPREYAMMIDKTLTLENIEYFRMEM